MRGGGAMLVRANALGQVADRIEKPCECGGGHDVCEYHLPSGRQTFPNGSFHWNELERLGNSST